MEFSFPFSDPQALDGVVSMVECENPLGVYLAEYVSICAPKACVRTMPFINRMQCKQKAVNVSVVMCAQYGNK